MSNAIALLEMMGQQAQLRWADETVMGRMLVDFQVGPCEASAILRQDSAALAKLLDAETIVCCALFPKKDNEDEEGDEPSKEDEIRAKEESRVLAVAI